MVPGQLLGKVPLAKRAGRAITAWLARLDSTSMRNAAHALADTRRSEMTWLVRGSPTRAAR